MEQSEIADPLAPKEGPELVIGLVAPVGAKIGLVCEVLKEELRKFEYRSQEIRVSRLLHQLKQYHLLSTRDFPSEYERIYEHMKAGTELRVKTERGDVLSLLSISNIRLLREQVNRENPAVKKEFLSTSPLERTAFILRSLKHKDEISTLRDIYGRAFVVISAYLPRADRVEALANVIAKSVSSSDPHAFRDQAEKLIAIDEAEGNKLGQNVSDAFPLADLFVDTRSREHVEKSVSRFLDLYFGHPFHTPTKDEFAMFHARSAALRSADLSRQVGAAIANKDGDIVAVGCNDVPKASGGQYWANDENDDRDFKRGYDSSARSKTEIVGEMLDRLARGKWLAATKRKRTTEDLVKELLYGEGKSILQDAQILDLLEYGRPVHAEMAALMDAARRGVAVQGATLYSTTFPCHLCARHIIAAGIARVVYIEPYPKSKAGELYRDSIVIDPQYPIHGRVQFEPFVGIAPVRYMALFEMPGKRKDEEGKVLSWNKTIANPRIKRFVLSYLLIEENVVGELVPRLLSEKGLEVVQ